MRGGLGLVLLVAAALPLACGGNGPGEERRRSDFFGVNAQFLSTLPSSRWEPHLDSMQRGRLGIVRRDAFWGAVEPRPPAASGRHVYGWRGTDTMVRALAEHGLRWYPILDYSAPWAASNAGDQFSPPARDADFGAFAQAVAARYGRQGSFWRSHPDVTAYPVHSYEVWNEPNTSLFWRPQRRAPERYASLYRVARSRIREVDPRARVVVGGLSTYVPGSTPVAAFLRRMAARLGGLRGVDAVGLHPYGDSLAAVLRSIRATRRALERLGGPSLPLEITEVGWSAVRTPEATRARHLAALARGLPRSGCGVEALLPHTWLSAESDRGNAEDWFGIANQDGSPKPSGRAYLRAVGSAVSRSGAPKSRVCPGRRR